MILTLLTGGAFMMIDPTISGSEIKKKEAVVKTTRSVDKYSVQQVDVETHEVKNYLFTIKHQGESVDEVATVGRSCGQEEGASKAKVISVDEMARSGNSFSNDSGKAMSQMSAAERAEAMSPVKHSENVK